MYNKEELKKEHNKQKKIISAHLNTFKNKSEFAQLQEFLFCILTPQSKAEKCWEAVSLIPLSNNFNTLEQTLKGKARFHKTKADRIVLALSIWPRIKQYLQTTDRKELRNWMANTVKGYGLKEAGHFLRNTGRSENQLAILDRHILNNLKKHRAINSIKIKNKKDYLKAEELALKFSKSTGIPPDDLDLLFWYREHGKYFK
jgi:N-glycosylase/DNA lyase